MAKARSKEEQAEYMREYRARKRQEQQRAGSIEAGATGVTSRSDKTHAACDARIAELEAEVRRLRRQVSTPAVDTSTVPGLEIHGIAAQGGTAGMAQTDPIHRPAFLAAPDDDCAACGHDRHRWVQDGVCKAPIGRGTCGCKEFATREELTF